jgi:hypothetical protein
MQKNRFPEFAIIGAVKAATTWLARNLDRNPALFLPGPEPHYFSSEYHRGIDWYADFFEAVPPDVTIGEKSADYLAHEEAAKRMARDLPGARLIVQLRNPIDRAYSDYCMLFRRGTVRDQPDAYFSTKTDVGRRFLESGLYARHLARFFDHFPRENILIVPFDDVISRPTAVLQRVSEYIGVSPHIEDEMLRTTENDSATPVLPLPMRQTLRPLKGAVSGLRGKTWFEAARGVFARPVQYPALSAEAHQHLADYYRDDIQKLSFLAGRDYSSWLRSPFVDGAASPPAGALAEASA